MKLISGPNHIFPRTVFCPATANLQDRVYTCRLSCHLSSPKKLRGNVLDFWESLI